MAHFNFLIQVSQQPLGFRLHLELGNADRALHNCKTDSGGMSKSERFSWLTFLLSAAHLVLPLCAEYLVSKHQDRSLMGQCLLSSSGQSCWAGQVKFNLAAWGEVGKVSGREGEESFWPCHIRARERGWDRPLVLREVLGGKGWEGRGER